jgi:hypothetical protein
MEHEALAMHRNNLRSRVTRIIKICILSWWSCFVKTKDERKTPRGKHFQNGSVCAIGLCYCFRELDGARNASDAQQQFTFSCNTNNKKMIFMLVELFCAKTIAHTANDRNEWAPGMPRKYVRIEQPRGSVLFWELRDAYFF